MERDPSHLTSSGLIRHGFAALFKPPFRTIWMILILVALVAPGLTAPGDDFSLVALVVLAVVTFILEMSAVLAAVSPAAEPSADLWIRKALRQRGLWRFVAASILTDLAVGFGLLALLIGGFIVAGMVGLAPQVALLEKKLPLQAFKRSAELTKPSRSVIATVYGLLVLLPTIAAVIPYAAGYEPSETFERVRGVLATTMTLAAWIALTRAFVELGGNPVEEETEAPAQTGAPPR